MRNPILPILLLSLSPALSAASGTALCPGSAACGLVTEWFEQGTAAGNEGDWYDNRDRGHSGRNFDERFGQFQRVRYTPAETGQGLDWGAQRRLLDKTVLGNSSTAAPVTRGGSNPRMLYTWPVGLRLLYAQYRASNLYVYPEHRDHDPGHNGIGGGFGDLYPTNSPFLIISQGSSGSDRPFMEAVALTLAAFRPEVKQVLRKQGLLMPTVQQILRSSLKDADYLSGEAHPTVFDAERLDAVAMVNAAHAITRPIQVPPLVQLSIVSEPPPEDRPFEIDSEVLGTTPGVIARIHRRADENYRITVSTGDSADLLGSKLKTRWVIGRGDPEKISIRPVSDHVAEITVRYHERYPVSPGNPLWSNRVDILAFVDNGTAISAPGFITLFTLDNELRTYDRGRLREIYFNAWTPQLTISDWEVAALSLNRLGVAPEQVNELQPHIEAWRSAKARQEVLAEKLEALKQPKDEKKRPSITETRKQLLTAEQETLALWQTPLPQLGNQSIEAYVMSELSDKQTRVPYLYRDYRERLYIRELVVALKRLPPGSRYRELLVHTANAEVIAREVYPEFVRLERRSNYVDPKISKAEDKLLSF